MWHNGGGGAAAGGGRASTGDAGSVGLHKLVSCERVWQRDHEYDTRTVEIFITRIRKKIDAPTAHPLIHTLRGIGYTIRT